ncbi:alanine or glycine:cation symporter, AGCS family [Colwellia chukchiensis]|uniref:Alanine or glycine:cation symporter, AGCS family n=1 Tax=Colwellia chukchiensis TaxID=641665 RepID=A0A1H7R548_9GAMM|nr:alanine/glycine:cation symporter family protein [Colwellia chukchiensis]SEL55118.1 alanine or glycine:cation symporter, AGCS family [Colwellia chukchiensis]
MSFDTIISSINNILWGEGQVLIYVLLFAGFWFSFQLKFLQIFNFRHMFSVLKQSSKVDDEKATNSGISSLQALFIGLSARVGTGNLAGVAVAISLGGSGAIFWMWVIALLGMATGFAESILGQLYKVSDEHKEYRGGPAYYIQQGLNQRWLASLFSVCLFLGYGFSFSAMQANTIADSLNHAFNIPSFYSGAIITLLAGTIVLGGLKRIARFAELIVPFMGLAFILVAVVITLMNLSALPSMFYNIFSSAFGLNEAGAGMLGAAIKNGIQRGLYSNEAGAGSVPHAAASARPVPNHPVTQGYVQMLGVFLDTMVLCTCTAVIILLADLDVSGEMEGIRLTQNAITYHLGENGVYFVSAAISLFAFTSVVANYAYAESNLHFFKLDNKLGRTLYTSMYLAMVFWGTSASLTQVWRMADVALGLMTLVNVIAIVQLTPTIVALTKDYNAKRNIANSSNKEMAFKAKDIKPQGRLSPGIWPDK